MLFKCCSQIYSYLIQVISTCCKCFVLLFFLCSDISRRYLKIFIEQVSCSADLKKKRC